MTERTESITETPITHPIQPANTEEMQKLLLRAQAGDLTCIPELRTLFESRPELWQEVGDVAAHAEMTMLALVGGNNLLAREAMRMKLADFKAELAGPAPSLLEKLMVQRIAISWLQVHHADLHAAAFLKSPDGQQSVHAQRRLDSAHKRYLQALRQLATVRKLLDPAPRPSRRRTASGAHLLTIECEDGQGE